MKDVKKRKSFVWIGVGFIKTEENKFSENRDEFFKYIKFVEKRKCLKHRKNRKKYFQFETLMRIRY
jgi:hypothetical protein